MVAILNRVDVVVGGVMLMDGSVNFLYSSSKISVSKPLWALVRRMFFLGYFAKSYLRPIGSLLFA